jgi:NAD(P)-dependent dehydrogenase (short-subunit alcohol dehydrogenase family)
MLVLDVDLASSTKAQLFAEAHPERFLQMGIAEQNMVGVAAGLATTGLCRGCRRSGCSSPTAPSTRSGCSSPRPMGISIPDTGHVGAECDVTSATSVDAAVGQMAAGGPLGAVVACAGIARPPPPTTTASGSCSRCTLGLVHVCRAAFPHLTAASGGAIVGISSICARLRLPHRLAYNAAKGAVDSVVRTLAVEWAPQCICVNAVAPGWVHTPAIARLIADGRFDPEPIVARTPLGRLAEPAETVAFLVSPAGSHTTGQILVVDGGLTVQGPSSDPVIRT